MEISKTDLQKVIAYLRDASEIYRTQPKAKHRWRGQLIRNLVRKLEKKLTQITT